jgi:hypothetical protein
MTSLRTTLCAAFAAALLAACGQSPAPADTASTESAQPSADPANCLTWANSGWSANDDRQGPDPRTLNVRGTVVFPSAGWTWTMTNMNPGEPDSGAVNLSLQPQPPEGPVTPVETPTEVSYSAPATAETYASVTVFCGRGPMTVIDEVTITQ